MRLTNALGTFVAGAAAIVALTFATDARADDFSVQGGNGSVTVAATKAGYHLNKEFPWKAGGKPVTPTWGAGAEPTTATISGLAKGTIEIKGAICGQGNCVPFTKTVEVK